MDLIRRVVEAFRAIDQEYDYSVTNVYPDYLIAESYIWGSNSGLKAGEYKKVGYTLDANNAVTISDINTWETVELDYKPIKLSKAESIKTKQSRFSDNLGGCVSLAESNAENGLRIIKGIGITVDQVNGNNRIYPKSVMQDALKSLNPKLNESNGQGKVTSKVTGEIEHPENGRPSLNKTAVKWDNATLNESGQVELSGLILNNENGKYLESLLDAGVFVGISQRAWGESLILPNGTEKIVRLDIKGYDLVAEPADTNGRVTESQEDMEKKDLIKVITDNKNLFPTLDIAVLENAELPVLQSYETAIRGLLGINESTDVVEHLKTLNDAKNKVDADEKAKLIAEAIKVELAKYNVGKLQDDFVKVVESHEFNSIDEVADFIKAEATKFEAKAAELKVKELGGNSKVSDIQVKPAFEAQTRLPEYIKPAFLLHESMVNTGKSKIGVTMDKLVDSKYKQDKLTAEFMDGFIKRNARQLKKEYAEYNENAQYQETNTASDVSMPTAALLPIIAEAFPKSVMLGQIDTGVTPDHDFKIFTEKFVGDPAASFLVVVAPTAYNAFTPAFTVPALGNWGDLPTHAGYKVKAVVPGTVVISGADNVEGTDFVIDYYNGRIRSLTANFVAKANTTTIAFNYYAIRRGEMAPIERVKQQVTAAQYSVAPNRLGTQISDELMRYSNSSLRYDAQGRAVQGAADWMARFIDKEVFYRAWSSIYSTNPQMVTSAYSKANALWNETNGLNVRIGDARDLVRNKFYPVEDAFLVTTETFAERISNSSVFQESNTRPDNVMDARGVVGYLKGLPLVTSTEFKADTVLFMRRDLVQYRIYSDMQIEGPFPTYDTTTGKMIDAQQFFIRVYDWMDSLVYEKGAAIPVTA